MHLIHSRVGGPDGTWDSGLDYLIIMGLDLLHENFLPREVVLLYAGDESALPDDKK